MSEGTLVLMVVSESRLKGREATDRLGSSLASWCSAGLLGPTALAPAPEVAARGADTPCDEASGRDWQRSTVGAVLSRGVSELWVVALRGPRSVGSDDREHEEDALARVRELAPKRVDVRAMTLTVPAAGRRYGFEDFSPMWDAHFVHDLRVTSADLAHVEAAAGDDALPLAAAAALCVCGGWSGAEGGARWQHQAAGPVRDPRIVHAQVRLLHAEPMDDQAEPEQPPWPTPEGGHFRRAAAGSKPPPETSRLLADACGFVCRPPAHTPPPRPAKGWGRLVARIEAAQPESGALHALRTLAGRTGGLEAGDGAGPRRLALAGARNDVASLVGHLDRSGFPALAQPGGAARPAPQAWRTLRGAVFALVDGSTMPVELAGGPGGATAGGGPRAEVTVWPDPAVLAPDPAGGTSVEAAARAAPPSSKTATGGPAGADAADPDDGAADAAAAARGETLIGELDEALRRALDDAVRGFVDNASLRTGAPDHARARAAQRRARRSLAFWLVLLCVSAVAAADQRWPFLAVAWEEWTPWPAVRLYDPMRLPTGWILVGAAVALMAVARLAVNLNLLAAEFRALHEGEHQRDAGAALAAHYAVEVLRLDSLRRQYEDHRRIVVELLHRPFGRSAHRGRGLPGAGRGELGFDVPPPVSMLVAAASISQERMDEARARFRARLTRSGWLAETYEEVLAVWRRSYRRRVVGIHPEPDDDVSEPGLAAFRDPGGGTVEAPRADFAEAVSGRGWALTATWLALWRRSLYASGDQTVDIDRLLGLLEPPTSVHGPVEAVGDAFFDLGPAGAPIAPADTVHRFSWQEMLHPDAAAVEPGMHAFGPPAPVAVSIGDSTTLLSWRVECSDPVRARDLRGWSGAAGGESAPEPRDRQGVV